MNAASANRTIILARVEEDFEVVGQARTDLGQRPKLRVVRVAKACCWISFGTAEDVEKARAYVATTGDPWHVFVYPTDEPDPMGRAKQDVLAAT